MISKNIALSRPAVLDQAFLGILFCFLLGWSFGVAAEPRDGAEEVEMGPAHAAEPGEGVQVLEGAIPPAVGEGKPGDANQAGEAGKETGFVSQAAPRLALAPSSQTGDSGSSEAATEAQLGGLESTVHRYQGMTESFQRAIDERITFKYDSEKSEVRQRFNNSIRDLEETQRQDREAAIQSFENFIDTYPDSSLYTPDVMFRLSELYFERSYDNYLLQQESFDEVLNTWTPSDGTPEPEVPTVRYEPTIAMMQRLITEYPTYRLLDGAYYLLGYCLSEQGVEESALESFQLLVSTSPDSRFSAEAWMRIGEYYFNGSKLQKARDAYGMVVAQEGSALFGKALYKLAWTHYRMGDPETAPHEFTNSVEIFLKLLNFNYQTKLAGKERGGDLLNEARQYIGIIYAEENWGGTDKLIARLEAEGDKPFVRPTVQALGDIYFDQTRFLEAIKVYELLQQRYDLHPQAPEVQEKIIAAYERLRDFKNAADSRQALQVRYSEGSDWYAANATDEKVIAYAGGLVRKSIFDATQFFHNQAQEYDDAGEIELAIANYEKAAAGYGSYLKRFPRDKQLYDLQYYYADALYYSGQVEKAARVFKVVRNADPNGEFFLDSAAGTVFGYEKVYKKAIMDGELGELEIVTSAERDANIEPVAKEIPHAYSSFIEAVDYLRAAGVKDDNSPGFQYKLARIFHAYDHINEALGRYREIIESYPGHQATYEFSVENIVDLLQVNKNYEGLVDFTTEMMTVPEVAQTPALLERLKSYRTTSQFMVASNYAKDDKHDEAAELYVKLVDENGKFPEADSALNNAAVSFEKGKRFESAMNMYQRIVDDYPNSARADAALFRVGVNATSFFDFDSALQTYKKLIKDYPKSERRADAFYNVAFALEQTQQYEKAAKQYLRYCDVFPERDDAADVCFRAGIIYEKMKQPSRVISTYKNFILKYQKDERFNTRVLEAHLKIAQSYEHLMDEPKARRKAKKKARNNAKERYETLLGKFKAKPDPKAAAYAAEAAFKLLEPRYVAYFGFDFTGSDEAQQKALMSQLENLKTLSKDYTSILKYKQVEWMLASLYRAASLYHRLTEQMFASECPPEYKKLAIEMDIFLEDLCDERRILLEEKAIQFEDAAVQAYEQVIFRGREYQIANKWTKETLIALNKLRREEWPLQKDAQKVESLASYGGGLYLGLDGKGVVDAPSLESEKPESINESAAADLEGEGVADVIPEGDLIVPNATGQAPPAGSDGAPPGAGNQSSQPKALDGPEKDAATGVVPGATQGPPSNAQNPGGELNSGQVGRGEGEPPVVNSEAGSTKSVSTTDTKETSDEQTPEGQAEAGGGTGTADPLPEGKTEESPELEPGETEPGADTDGTDAESAGDSNED
ncbi:MAG: tetratricopeptide repeat protein [Myxococcota bacterium]|nr:tetratricopeptide repeat protein [Myxococcota bacterium]